MRRRTIWSAILVAIALSASAGAVPAKTPGTMTGAGNGIFPSGAAFNGVSLSTLRIGMGVSIAANGTAAGDFESTLLGSSAGQPRNITVEGKPDHGSIPSAGRATFSGICNIDMGDGTAPLSGVPFTANAVAGVNGTWALTLSLGSTNLPTATGAQGRITAGK